MTSLFNTVMYQNNNLHPGIDLYRNIAHFYGIIWDDFE